MLERPHLRHVCVIAPIVVVWFFCATLFEVAPKCDLCAKETNWKCHAMTNIREDHVCGWDGWVYLQTVLRVYFLLQFAIEPVLPLAAAVLGKYL